MTNSRNKELLSETAKTYLQELWIEQEYGREKYITSEPMKKGTMVESDSLELVKEVTQKVYFKNKIQYENEFVTGTPDVTKPLIDIKSSWDLWTFADVTEDEAIKTYFWQVAGYAWMLGTKEAMLAYALVDTPDSIIENEIFKLSYHMPESEAQAYRNNYIFKDIPAEKRLKIFKVGITDENIKELQERIELARTYLNQLEL